MDDADDLLGRALLEPDDAAAVALGVRHLPVSDTVTVIFHGRRDLGTIQTYVAPGTHGGGEAIAASDLLRVPADLDLHDAHDRASAAELYTEQARTLRDAIVAAETVLSIWMQPLAQVTGCSVDVVRSVQCAASLPAHRLVPVALQAAERRLTVTPVCGARPLAQGTPPLGIACAQQDVAHVYPLSEDPESCLEDFLDRAADHAHQMAARLAEQEISIARFMELNADDDQRAA